MAQWLCICLPPMWPGFDSRTRRQMWVEFVVGSRPCSERFFSGYSGFPLSSKTNISKFQLSRARFNWSLTLLCVPLGSSRTRHLSSSTLPCTQDPTKGPSTPFVTSYVAKTNKTTNNRTMFPALKKQTNPAAVYKGAVEIEVLKDAGLPTIPTKN